MHILQTVAYTRVHKAALIFAISGLVPIQTLYVRYECGASEACSVPVTPQLSLAFLAPTTEGWPG